MTNRSNEAWNAHLDRVYTHCERCFFTGARYSKKGGKTLCKSCRNETQQPKKGD